MSRVMQEGCIASYVWYFLLLDHTQTWCLLPHFCLSSLLHMNPVHSQSRHLHVLHGLSNLLARLSLRLIINLYGDVCNLLSYSFHRMALGENSVGFTLCKKQFMDLSLLSAGCCPYR